MKSLEELEARRRQIDAEKRAKRGEQDNVVQFTPKSNLDEVPPELAAAIPDDSFTDDEKSLPDEVISADHELEQFVRSVSIEEAYKKYIGKKIGDRKPDGEIMISCPMPDHQDNNPSASFDPETGLWNCHGICDTGGDILDLMAIGKGVYPEYKRTRGQDFHNFLRAVGEDYGWKVEVRNGIPVPLSPTRQKQEEEDRVKKARAAEQKLAQLRQQKTGELPPSQVIDIRTGEEIEEDEDDDYEDDPHFGDPFQLDWRPLVKENSFLDEYMKACAVNFIPEEFHFWNAMVALGFAAGRDVKFEETYANLFVCHLGPTAGGKSSSISPLLKVLDEVLPYDPSAPDRRGVYQLPTGASGEFIIDELQGEVKATGKGLNPVVPLGHAPGRVKGLINYGELSELLKRISRQGSTIQETLFKLVDCEEKVSTGSRTGGKLVAKEPFASLVTTNQPQRLQNQLTKDDAYSGFLNRFIFTAGPRKPKPTRGRIPVNLSKAIVQLKAVSGWIHDVNGGNIILEWSEDGGSRWDDFCAKTIHPVEESGSETIKRINTVMIKLVMLFAINAHETVVSKQSVENAIALWDYLLKTYKIVDDKVMTSSVSQMEEDILEAFNRRLMNPKNKKPYVTASEVYNSVRRKYSRTDVYKTFETLVKIGELAEFKPPVDSKGRPPKSGYTLRGLA